MDKIHPGVIISAVILFLMILSIAAWYIVELNKKHHDPKF
jgi:hypothetical protein